MNGIFPLELKIEQTSMPEYLAFYDKSSHDMTVSYCLFYIAIQ